MEQDGIRLLLTGTLSSSFIYYNDTQVPAFAECVLNGFLSLRGGTSSLATPLLSQAANRGANRRWFVLLPDFVLYSFRGPNDLTALTASPLPGLFVYYGHAHLKGDSSVSDKDKDRTIKITHVQSNYLTQRSLEGGAALLGQGAGHQGVAVLRKVYYLVAASVEEAKRLGVTCVVECPQFRFGMVIERLFR